jgi:hypothetical protein
MVSTVAIFACLLFVGYCVWRVRTNREAKNKSVETRFYTKQ